MLILIVFGFLDLTCHLEDMGIGVFWLHCRRLIVRKPNLEVATKKLLHQMVKIPRIECHVAYGSVSLHLFLVMWYFRGPWVSFVMTDEFSVRVTKNTSRILPIFEVFVRISLDVTLFLSQTLLTFTGLEISVFHGNEM